MKQSNTLAASNRQPSSKRENRRMRASGLLPASMSSKGEDAKSLSIRRDELVRMLSRQGMSTVFNLKVDDKTSYNAMVKEIQRAPLTAEILHVTFQHVSLKEETKADVTIQIVGRDSLEFKKLDFIQHLDSLPVRGLPQDIPNTIDADVAEMDAGDNLYVRDLVLGDGIETDMEPDRLVFTVSMPRLYVDETVSAEEAETEGTEESAEPAAEV